MKITKKCKIVIKKLQNYRFRNFKKSLKLQKKRMALLACDFLLDFINFSKTDKKLDPKRGNQNRAKKVRF